MDLTNSFARVVTDQRIRMKFFPEPEGTSGPDASEAGAGRALGSPLGAEGLGLSSHPWYPEFMAGLRAVGVDGTARGLRAAWVEAGLPRSVLSKTGTLNEPGEATPTDDLFAKSLLFAVGESGGTPGSPLQCGLVGGLYLRFSQGPESGNLPSYQVDFATQRLGRFLQEYWEEFGACPAAGG